MGNYRYIKFSLSVHSCGRSITRWRAQTEEQQCNELMILNLDLNFQMAIYISPTHGMEKTYIIFELSDVISLNRKDTCLRTNFLGNRDCLGKKM